MYSVTARNRKPISSKMSGLFITLVLSLVFSVSLISVRSDATMLREYGIHCHKEGLNANSENNKQFVICAKDGEGEFVGATYSCSEGEEFDQNTMSCTKMHSWRKLRNINLLSHHETDEHRKPGSTITSGTTPSGNTPSGTTPSGNTPSGNTPSGNTPSGNIPSGNTPSGNTPNGNTPSGNTPSTNTPSTNTPSTNTPTTTTTTPAPIVNDCKNRSIHCPDCHTLRLCYEIGGAYQHLSDVPCNEGDFCDDSTASCTSRIPPTCPADFKCTESGYFPDPSDCTKYYICYASENQLVASTQYCAANQVYSLSTKMCVRKIRLSDCQLVKCPAGLVQHAVFPGDASYYVICMNGKPEYVFHCGDGKEFSLSTKNCEVTCKAAGRMPDPDHCNQYYECTSSWLGSKFTLTSHSCPPGLGFNKATLLCDGETTCNENL